MKFDNVVQPILVGVVGSLKPNALELALAAKDKDASDVTGAGMDSAPDARGSETAYAGMTSVLSQQAAAARLVGMMATESYELADRMVQLQVVGNLLFAMSNVHNLDGQKQAARALLVLLDVCPYCVEHVRAALGSQLFMSLRDLGADLCGRLTPVQLELLAGNSVVIPITAK